MEAALCGKLGRYRVHGAVDVMGLRCLHVLEAKVMDGDSRRLASSGCAGPYEREPLHCLLERHPQTGSASGVGQQLILGDASGASQDPGQA